MQAATQPLTKARNVAAERERLGWATATPERLAKAAEGLDPGYDHSAHTAAARGGVQRIAQAPLDRMRANGAITAREFDAGDKFRMLAYLAAIDPSTGSVNWDMAGYAGRSGKIPAMFSTQRIADARLEFRRLEKAVTGLVWSVLKNALVHEHSLTEIGKAQFGYQRVRDAQVAGTAGVRTALCALADAYGQ